MGADVKLLDSGCCGMAGSFGFEAHKYDVSMDVFAHELQSYVEAAPKDTILMIDGFSCKTQVEQATGRDTLHIAQLIKKAADWRDRRDDRQTSYLEARRNDGYKREWITAGIALGIIGSGLLAWKRTRR
jgi:hypothetical protein